MTAGAHRFSWRLYAGMLGLFVALFAAEAALDLWLAARRGGLPLAEAWRGAAGSLLHHAEAGGALARAGYSALSIFVAVFALAIPFASTLYTSNLVALFLADRVNLAALALGIVASADTHFLTTATGAGHQGAAAYAASLALVALAWAAILPYAFYAWGFLSPPVVLARLEQTIRRRLLRAARSSRREATLRASIHGAILDIANMAFRAIDRADRDLTLDAVRALGRAYQGYLERKAELPAAWFEPERAWFAGLSREAFHLVERERTWVGHLLLHQIFLAYQAALARTPDVAGKIATIALDAAATAGRRGDEAVVALGLRFANTFLREAVKRGDAAIVQGVARVERAMLAEIAPRFPARVAEAAGHLAYYHDYARALGAHESADTIALALARLVEAAARAVPDAVAGAAEAVERLAEPGEGPGRAAVVKARALAAAALEEAGRGAEAARLRARVAEAAREDREAVRAGLLAAETRDDAGREVYGLEPGLEFVAEPRRSQMLALLAAA